MKHLKLTIILSFLVCIFSACSTVYDEPEFHWKDFQFKRGELDLQVKEVGYDFATLSFGNTISGSLALNDITLLTFTDKSEITLTNLARSTTYNVRVHSYTDNSIASDTASFTTSVPFLEAIAIQDITLNKNRQGTIKCFERMPDGDFIECIGCAVLTGDDNHGIMRRIDSYGKVKWENSVNAEHLNINMYGKIAAISSDDIVYVIDEETGNTVSVCKPSSTYDMYLHDACVGKDGIVEAVGTHNYYGRFDAQGNKISEDYKNTKLMQATGLTLRSDGCFSVIGRISYTEMGAGVISQDGIFSKTDNDYKENRDDRDESLDFRHSCADANGNTYFLGCESVKESFYYIYPILVKINADGKISWTKRLRCNDSYSYTTSLYCNSNKLYTGFTQEGDTYKALLVTDIDGNQISGINFGQTGSARFITTEPNSSNYLIYRSDGYILRCIPDGYGSHPDFSIE